MVLIVVHQPQDHLTAKSDSQPWQHTVLLHSFLKSLLLKYQQASSPSLTGYDLISPVETWQFTVPWYVRKLENKKNLAEDLDQQRQSLFWKVIIAEIFISNSSIFSEVLTLLLSYIQMEDGGIPQQPRSWSGGTVIGNIENEFDYIDQ